MMRRSFPILILATAFAFAACQNGPNAEMPASPAATPAPAATPIEGASALPGSKTSASTASSGVEALAAAKARVVAPVAETQPLASAPPVPVSYPEFVGTRIGLVHTANVVGEIEDCGCRRNPMGGLSRKATVIAERLAEGADERWDGALVFDAGDLFQPGFTVADADRKRVDATSAFILEQFKVTGCHGFVPGDRDLVLGRSALVALAKDSICPFLAANLMDTKTKKPVFPATTVHEVAGVKVGVFGLTLPTGIRGPAANDGWTVSDPIAAAQAAVTVLQAQGVDVIVALTHLTAKGQAQLAKEVPGITAILGGNTTRLMQHPEADSGAYIVDAFSKGKYVSALTLNRVKDAKPGAAYVDRFRRSGLDKKIQGIEGRIASYERILTRKQEEAAAAKVAAETVTAAAEGAAVTAKALVVKTVGVSFYEQQLVKMRAELQENTMDRDATEGVDPNASFIAYSMIPLPISLPEEPGTAAAITEFRKTWPKTGGH